jgi:hypothetical protein
VALGRGELGLARVGKKTGAGAGLGKVKRVKLSRMLSARFACPDLFSVC